MPYSTDWTIENFSPFQGKETVGTATAVYHKNLEDEFRFSSSLNLDIQETVDDFIAKAKQAQAEHIADYSQEISTLEAQLNA